MPTSTDYPSAAARNTWEKHGERPSVKDWGALGDVRSISDAVVSGTTLESVTAEFTAADVGKEIVIFGAGGVGDRESLIAEKVTTVTATNSWAVDSGSEIDAENATEVKFAFNCRDFDMDWAVFGSNDAGYAGEVQVHTDTQTALAASDSYSISSPPYRYYRAKVKSTVTDELGVGYTTAIALGYLHSTTIASVTDSETAELTDAVTSSTSGAWAQFGTDDTAAIQGAIDALANAFTSGGDGGLILEFPRGVYLVTAQIVQKQNITCRGAGGSGAWIIAHAAEFPTTTALWKIGTGSTAAFFTRLEDIRLNCNHVPGSTGVYSELIQENSGLHRVSVFKWLAKGIHLTGYGCQHYQLGDLWIYPSNAAFLNSSVYGIYIDTTVSWNPIHRATVIAQGGHICGYGTAIYLTNTSASLYDIHIESAAVGVEFASGSTGKVLNINGHQSVAALIKTTSSSPISAEHYTNTGATEILDPNAGSREFNDSAASRYLSTSAPMRIRGNSNADNPILEVIPGQWASGYPTFRITKRGKVLIGDERYDDRPNIPIHDTARFDSPAQGGFFCVNSESGVYPNWEQLSTRFEFTVDTGTNTLTAVGHGFSENAAVQVVSDGTLPTGLTEGPEQTYYAKNVSGDDLQLSLTAGGAAVSISTTGSGTHYIARYVGAAFYRMGASRYEIRYGKATNDDGTSPGTLVFRADRDAGVYAPLIYFDNAADPNKSALKWGNESGVHRARWVHGESGQKYLEIERSDDSGMSWEPISVWMLDKRMLQLWGIYFAASGNQLLFGNDTADNRARWEHGGTDQKYLKLQGSTNAGVDWDDILIFDLTTAALILPHIWFDASSPLKWGNDTDDNQAQWVHQGTDQKFMELQRSVNAGSSFSQMLKIDLSTGEIWNVNFKVSDNSDATHIVFEATSAGAQAAAPVIDVKNGVATKIGLYSEGQADVKRLGVDYASLSFADGEAAVKEWLGVGTNAKNSSEKLYVNGISRLDGDIETPDLSNGEYVKVVGGKLMTVSAATLLSEIGAVSTATFDAHTHNIPLQGAHDHAGAVASDGDHDHGDTDPPT